MCMGLKIQMLSGTYVRYIRACIAVSAPLPIHRVFSASEVILIGVSPLLIIASNTHITFMLDHLKCIPRPAELDMDELRKATAMTGGPEEPDTSGHPADRGVRVATVDNYQGVPHLLSLWRGVGTCLRVKAKVLLQSYT
jgi:hypothetical protein